MTEDNIIPFKKALPNPTNPGIPGFDEYGVPNLTKQIVYGVTVFKRGKAYGTMLFLNKETRDSCIEIYTNVVKEAGLQAEYKYEPSDFPVF